MNSFDKIQCEETAEYQFATMMQELHFLKEQHEKQAIEIQKELDEWHDKQLEAGIDEIFAAEIDF